MPREPDSAERAALLQAAYSRAGQAEPVVEHVDSDTGRTVRMRESEWLLREFDRRQSGERPPAVDDSPQPAVRRDPEPMDPPPDAPVRQRWRAVGLVTVGLLVGAGIATAVPIIASAVNVAPPPGVAAEPVTSPLTGRTVLPPLARSDLSPALDVFTRPATPVKRVPADISEQFDPQNIHRIFEPSANGGGFDVFVVRKDVGFYCLVLLRLHEKYVASCATDDQIARDGLRLIAIADPPTTSSEHLAGGPTEAPTTPTTPWQVAITWNSDGTFSLTGAPLEGAG